MPKISDLTNIQSTRSGESRCFPQGMTIAPKDNLYYAQYDMEYSVGGNGDNVIKADNYKLNLYYNPSKRGEKICDIKTIRLCLLAEKNNSGSSMMLSSLNTPNSWRCTAVAV